MTAVTVYSWNVRVKGRRRWASVTARTPHEAVHTFAVTAGYNELFPGQARVEDADVEVEDVAVSFIVRRIGRPGRERLKHIVYSSNLQEEQT